MTMSAFGVEDGRISKASTERWAQKKERSVGNQAAINAGIGGAGVLAGVGTGLAGIRRIPTGVRVALKANPKLLVGATGVGTAYGAGVGAAGAAARNKKIRESRELVAARRQRQDSTA